MKRKFKIGGAMFFTILAFYTIVALSLNNEKDEIVDYFDSKIYDMNDKHQQQINVLKAGISQDDKRRSKIIDIEKGIQLVNSEIPYETRFLYAELIVDETENKVYLTPELLAGIISQESRFKFKAKSVVGAKGLGQLMPLTAEDQCKHLGIVYYEGIEFEPKMNVKLSAFFMERLLSRYKNEQQALAYYNGGGYNAYSNGLKRKNSLTKNEKIDLSKLAKETEEYVPRVLSFKKKFKGIE